MERRPLGSTGLHVSVLGFGAGAIGREELEERRVGRLLGAALDAGITLFDAARSYGLAESRLGRHLAARRQHVVLSTKGGYGVTGEPDWTGRCITQGIERALSELGTDWIDIFHLHSCPLEVAQRDDILAALSAARGAGKIRVAGYSADNEALRWAVESGHFGAVECSLSLVDQANRPAIQRAAARGVGVIVKRPLANAVWTLPSEPHAPDTRAYWQRWQALRLGADAQTQALRFAAFAQGVGSAIVGCSSEAHLSSNLAAVREGALTPEDVTDFNAAFDAVGAWPAVI